MPDRCQKHDRGGTAQVSSGSDDLGSMTPCRYVATAMLAALAFSACGDAESVDEPATARDPSSTSSEIQAPTSSAGLALAAACTPGSGYEPGTTSHQLTIAGATREFLVHVPPEPVTEMPLVVSFHFAGSDMHHQMRETGWDALADTARFVVATPNGIDSELRQWSFLGAPEDVAVTDAIVDDLVAHACVDADQVYASGISSGSAMTTSLACQASDRFAGFGLVALAYYIPPFCDAAPVRPIIIFHGTDDASIPYEGGTVGSGSGRVVEPVEEVAAQWAQHNGCAPGPTETQFDTEVVQVSWSGCVEPVVFYRIVGGGHTWPGAAALEEFGHTTSQISASDEMWRFWTAVSGS